MSTERLPDIESPAGWDACGGAPVESARVNPQQYRHAQGPKQPRPPTWRLCLPLKERAGGTRQEQVPVSASQGRLGGFCSGQLARCGRQEVQVWRGRGAAGVALLGGGAADPQARGLGAAAGGAGAGEAVREAQAGWANINNRNWRRHHRNRLASMALCSSHQPTPAAGRYADTHAACQACPATASGLPALPGPRPRAARGRAPTWPRPWVLPDQLRVVGLLPLMQRGAVCPDLDAALGLLGRRPAAVRLQGWCGREGSRRVSSKAAGERLQLFSSSALRS